MSDFPSKVPTWVKWVPAVLLAIIITIVVVFAVNEGPRLAAGPGPAETNEVDDLNFSVFTDEGLGFIEAQRIPRIDLRKPPVETEPLGLPADGEVVIGPHPQDLDYRLVLLASKGEQGARFTTPGFVITTAEGAISQLRIQPTRGGGAGAFPTFRDVEAFVNDSAERFGFAPIASGTLTELVVAAQETGEPQELTTETGITIGLPTRIDVVCLPDAFCQAEIVIDVE
jgi:hypothetical protein